MNAEGSGVMDIPVEAYEAARKATSSYLAPLHAIAAAQDVLHAAAPHIQAPLLARIAELEAKLAESERLAGVLREQRNKAEDELRGRA